MAIQTGRWCLPSTSWSSARQLVTASTLNLNKFLVHVSYMPANAADCLQADDIKIQYGIWNIEYRLGNMKNGEFTVI